jgi:hypothetical protein
VACAEGCSDDKGGSVRGNRREQGALDAALGFAGELFGGNNDAREVAELVSQLRKLGPELIVLEASGRTSGISV